MFDGYGENVLYDECFDVFRTDTLRTVAKIANSDFPLSQNWTWIFINFPSPWLEKKLRKSAC